MKRAIITGATGAVGMALIQELIKNEIEVLVFCREGSLRNERIPKHPLVSLKYCSLDQLAEVENNSDKSYDVFYHFAWEGTTGTARNDMYLQNLNVRYALDAVHAAHRFGCNAFIGAGSQAEYGRVEGILKSDTPTFPEMGYGIAKLCAGQMTREAAHQLGLKHIWARILSVYGPFDGEQSMIMATIHNLKIGVIPKFTKGEQIWDYLYSSDAARAFYLLGEFGHDGKVYVMGSGQAKPLVEYIKVIRDSVDKNAELDIGAIPYSKNQVMYLCADIKELVKDIGYHPSVSFITGIKRIIDSLAFE